MSGGQSLIIASRLLANFRQQPLPTLRFLIDRLKKVLVWWAVADHRFTAASQFQATATAHPTILDR
ncbi:MAG: hypothetical protein F6K50_30780 [Moorea sp. SIO3I7]|nr:hypothetical protein [Moorena sp. SIO3I7]